MAKTLTHGALDSNRHGTICARLDSLDAVTVSDSDRITCKQCQKTLGSEMPRSNGEIVDEILGAKISAALEADERVSYAKKSFDAALEDAKKTVRRAAEELDREATRDPREHATTRFGSRATAVAVAVNRVTAQYIANNLRLDMLVEYGAQYDAAIKSVADHVRKQDEANTAASLRATK